MYNRVRNVFLVFGDSSVDNFREAEMSIRQISYANERATLCPQAMLCENTAGRLKEIEADPIRTEYQRDRDRIIHSKAFRRLMHKTQVFLCPNDDHYRTRLTHTLEVTQIARTIARALRLNEDLTEAIALGHDLGHTPFGHAGERLLQRCYDKDFAHYKQSLRVVDVIEELNLTFEVRDGIVNHAGDNLASTLEGRIVKQADRIAYISHDIDDALRAGVLMEDDIPLMIRNVLGYNHSERIGTMVGSIIKRGIADSMVLPEEHILESMTELRAFLFEAVYTNPVAKSEEVKAESMLATLYDYFINHPDELPVIYKTMESDTVERRVADYISGMTDRYAIDLFKKLFIPLEWDGVTDEDRDSFGY